MKKITLLVFNFIFISFIYSQHNINPLIGLWQAEQVDVTSMYHDTYRFTENGSFTFKPDEYNGLNRIISINGIYRINGDTLFLTPKFTKELIGGYPIRSENTTISDTWEIVGGVLKTIICKKKGEQFAIIKLSQKSQCLFIDERIFYRIN
jgi:hypothetical protein